MTFWSDYDRIHGISFMYLKSDGSTIEPDNQYFLDKSLRQDIFDLDDGDSIKELYGKYNVKGVKVKNFFLNNKFPIEHECCNLQWSRINL